MSGLTLSGRRVLVTGGAGFIGSHVVDALIDAGCQVSVVDDLSTGQRANVNHQATFYELDIRDEQLLDVFVRERPQAVSHHAAQSSVQVSLAKPLRDAQVNVVGTLNLLNCAVQSGVEHVIYISTGGAIYGDPKALPCDEGQPAQPLSPYAVSKYAGEQYVFQMAATSGMRTTVLRYANVYGPRQDPRGEAGVIAIFAGQMLGDLRPTINGDGRQERDFVYVGDCAKANLLALQTGASGVFNLGTGVGTSIIDLYRQLASVVGYRDEPTYGPPKLGETRRIYLDATKAGQTLGWVADVPLRRGLELTVDSLSNG